MGKLKIIFGDTLRTLRKLFLEVMGTFFIALGVLGIGSVVDEYRKYANAPDDGIVRLIMSVIFAVVMVLSALHTFWKARKTR